MLNEVTPTELVNVENKTWRGTSIRDICKNKGHWSFAVTPLLPSKYHHVLYDVPIASQGPPKVHHTRDIHLWDNEHVRMPYSAENLFSVNENNSDVIRERWKIINEVLAKPISTSQQFEAAIRKYNGSLPKFEALHYFLNEELEKEESQQFFTKLLPKIIALALRLPELLPCGIPLLKQNHNRSLSMSQLQISCLLANAFLCTFPWKKSTAMSYPGVNFVCLFSAFSRPKRKQCVCEKLKSICNYFRRVTYSVPVGVVTFERKFIPRSSMPRWDALDNNLGNTKIHISSEGTIEDKALGFLQVDFANKNIGGGVLRYGCVQEEIRFMICSELIISRLFVEQLGNGESIIITGAERYNNYTGYGDTFEWAGNCVDETPFDVYGRRKTTLCVIDATRFNKPKEQFHSSLMIRELNKAYVGFTAREKENLAPVATGNWGCGAFNGSKQLKTLIQLMACSVAGRDLVYYSFGDEELMENFYNIYLFLGNNRITIVQLWRFLNQFALRKLDENRLYSFIQQAYFDSKKQPSMTNFFNKANDLAKEQVHTISPSTSFKKKPKISPKKSPEKEKNKYEEDIYIVEESLSSSSSSEDIIPSSQPELIPRKCVTKPKPANIVNKLPKTDLCEIFDLLDGNGNRSKTNIPDVGVSSTSEVLPTFDKLTSLPKDSPLEDIFIIENEKMELDILPESQTTPSKKKITDFFTKINK